MSDRPEPELRHPFWCSPKHCSTEDPETKYAAHRSAPAELAPAPHTGWLRIEAWLTAPENEEAFGPATLILSFSDNEMGVLPYSVLFELEAWQAEGLITGLAPLVRALAGHNREPAFYVDQDAAERARAERDARRAQS